MPVEASLSPVGTRKEWKGQERLTKKMTEGKGGIRLLLRADYLGSSYPNSESFLCLFRLFLNAWISVWNNWLGGFKRKRNIPNSSLSENSQWNCLPCGRTEACDVLMRILQTYLQNMKELAQSHNCYQKYRKCVRIHNSLCGIFKADSDL